MKRYSLPLVALLSCALFAGGCASTAEQESDSEASNNAISGSILDAKAEKLKNAYLAADANDFFAVEGVIKTEDLTSSHAEGYSARDARWYTWIVEQRAYLTVDYQVVGPESSESVVIIFQLLDQGAELRVAPGDALGLARAEPGEGTISMKAVLYFIPATATQPAVWQTSRGELPSSVPAPIAAQ